MSNSRIAKIINAKFSGHHFYELEQIGRFSNLHKCTFKSIYVTKKSLSKNAAKQQKGKLIFGLLF